ncbi:MAG: hypothetical protein Q9174_001629 [Haloplaca sp. 1 TL-2023]
MIAQVKPDFLRALVDIGSNGVRYSISELSPDRARIMPTIYQDRSAISLYDAQYKAGKPIAIPQPVIDDLLINLVRFKRTCEDFEVPHDRVRVVATEATRKALNGDDLRQQVERATGWSVELLAKEEEGRIGALGVASSFHSIKGLVMDLGGGSIQMTWMTAQDGEVKTSPKGAVSFPYGAAALMRRLGEIDTNGLDSLRQEMSSNFETALQQLEVPEALAKAANDDGGWTMYLSGGGFRGWGYILMSLHSVAPYPIPIINGFRVPKSSFLPNLDEYSDPESMFRISSRRASQVPAVNFLIKALVQSIPSISYIHFAQGGIREGLLFSALPPSIQSQHPLVAATQTYAPAATASLVRILQSTLPQTSPSANDLKPPAALTSPEMLTSIVHLLHVHASSPKDIRASSALRSTTTGLLGDAHGLSHVDRCLLALVLCERWGGDPSPSDEVYLNKMQELAGVEASWWAKYVGCSAAGIGELFPAGVVRTGEENQVKAEVGWSAVEKKGKREVALGYKISTAIQGVDSAVEAWRLGMEKVGKKKNHIGGRDGWGVRILASVER